MTQIYATAISSFDTDSSFLGMWQLSNWSHLQWQVSFLWRTCSFNLYHWHSNRLLRTNVNGNSDPLSLTIMVPSIHSRWPTWITCQSLQSIYSQQEFLANSFQMKMVLIDKAQELPQCLMIILFFGIMVNFARLTRLTLLAFQNCFLTLVTLNYSLSQHFCSHTMTTQFTGLFALESKKQGSCSIG